jgi:Skp family chaperone for outer membrane proteins
MDGFRGATAVLVAVTMGLSTIAAPASAAIVGTEQMLSQSQSEQGARQAVDAFLARAEVLQQMQDWGLNPVDAQQRVAALTESELQTLSTQINELPAGAGALEVIGVVFLVLLILELVGVINVFSAI